MATEAFATAGAATTAAGEKGAFESTFRGYLAVAKTCNKWKIFGPPRLYRRTTASFSASKSP